MSTAVTASEQDENIRMIRESAAGTVTPERLAQIRGLRHTLPGIDPAHWSMAAELGWLGLRTPEALGGVGMGMAEFCALAEELGRGLTPETILHVAALAPLLPDDVRDAVITGERVVLPAWQEALGNPDSLATKHGNAVEGVKRYVPYAMSATDFLVSTQTGLALVAKDAPGSTLTTEKRQDGGHWGMLTLKGTPGQKLDGTTAEAREEITLALSAYLLGVMSRTFDITREYLQTRRQFDKPIGAFQSIQHRMVDLFLQIELTRASVGQTAMLFDRAVDFKARQIAVSRAKARASDASLIVTRSAVQCHGAIGYTDDCDVGLFLRKAMVLSNSFGSSSYHRKRFAALSGLAQRTQAS